MTTAVESGTYTAIMSPGEQCPAGDYPRREILTRIPGAPASTLARGVTLQTFVSRDLGAEGLFTGMATLGPAAEMPWHVHDVSEAITVLRGQIVIVVEGRYYRMADHDSIHIPANVPHMIRNGLTDHGSVLHLAFASGAPRDECVDVKYTNRYTGAARSDTPETLRRFRELPWYEPSRGARFRDLFASRFGSKGICGGYGLFQPGAGLPCHIHVYDESITIIDGTSALEAAGAEHDLSGCDTACVPRGLPHRFVNKTKRTMEMIWVYGGDEPAREVVDQFYCDQPDPLPR